MRNMNLTLPLLQAKVGEVSSRQCGDLQLTAVFKTNRYENYWTCIERATSHLAYVPYEKAISPQ